MNIGSIGFVWNMLMQVLADAWVSIITCEM